MIYLNFLFHLLLDFFISFLFQFLLLLFLFQYFFNQVFNLFLIYLIHFFIFDLIFSILFNIFLTSLYLRSKTLLPKYFLICFVNLLLFFFHHLMNIKLRITNFAHISPLWFILRFWILPCFLSTLQTVCQWAKVTILCILIIFIGNLATIASFILYLLRAWTFILHFQLEYLIIEFILMLICMISNLNLKDLWLHYHLF